MTNHPFESTGMVTDPGKVTRNLKLVSDYAKAQNIPLSAASSWSRFNHTIQLLR